MEELKIIELFGGIGAPRKALKNIGYNVDSTYVEIDKFATKSYNAIFKENHETIDICEYDGTKLRHKIDMLMGGFPCTSLSAAGSEKGMAPGSGTPSALAWEMMRVIEEIMPTHIFIENVVRLIEGKNKVHFDIIIGKLKLLGYYVTYNVEVATDYGLPQKRKRVFIVASKTDTVNKRIQNGYELFNWNKLEKYEMRHISSFFDLENKNKEKLDLTEDFKRNYITAKDNTGKFAVSDKMIINPSIVPTITTREGCTRIASSTYMSPDFDYDTNVCGIDMSIHPVRKLSTLEMWRLMGFDDSDWEAARQVCSKTQLIRQAGNSMCVPIVESIFKELLK